MGQPMTKPGHAGGLSATARTRDDIFAEAEMLATDAGLPPAVAKLYMLFGELDRTWREKYLELARAASSIAEARDAALNAVAAAAVTVAPPAADFAQTATQLLAALPPLHG